MVNYAVGIFYDPREPPPPGFQAPHFHPHGGPRPAPAPLPPYRNANGSANANTAQLPPPGHSVLPPLSVSLTAQIVHDTAKVSVTQIFLNNSNNVIPKGAYTFPLPAGCTVVEFSCRVGSTRIVRGRVKPKLEAREAFDDAARRNRPAALFEQDTPEIFTTTLANIPADTKLQAEISFVTLLNHRFFEDSVITTLTIPTYIASRYGTAPPDFQRDSSAEPPQGLSVRIEVLAAEHIISIGSNTHNVTVERDVSGNICQSWNEFVTRGGTEDPKTALVELADGSTFLDKDFVLDITTLPQGGLESPHACIEAHPSLEHHNAVMITIPPKFMLANQSPIHESEVLFIADRSGSMIDKIEALKSAMKFFLHGIPQGKYFNIWCFGSDYTNLWPRSQKYSDSTLREALAYVSQYFRADMGGTELLPALKAVVQARGDHQMTDVIMLTDGEVWRLDETIDFIQQTSSSTEGRVRFFALGIGDAVSHELVGGVAKAGGGYAEVIPAASQGGWEDRVVAVLRAALTGHIGPLKIEYERVDGQIVNGENAPCCIVGLLFSNTNTTKNLHFDTSYLKGHAHRSSRNLCNLQSQHRD
jgi:Vault protein inter-alpha-trypsin domain/von Willebrand factor type A domain